MRFRPPHPIPFPIPIPGRLRYLVEEVWQQFAVRLQQDGGNVFVILVSNCF